MNLELSGYILIIKYETYYYKNCNEIKFLISLCSKKVRQIFVPVCSRIATQADNEN